MLAAVVTVPVWAALLAAAAVAARQFDTPQPGG
jgi:hypothetical protein